jgi:hypothetical protein
VVPGGVTIRCSFSHCCCRTAWVYCIDAQCGPPDKETGVSLCDCWIQTPGKSELPANAEGGAPCVITNTSAGSVTNPYGSGMCDSMKSGELWSTFGTLSVNTSYLPPFVLNNCPAHTGFTYCWGAKCYSDPDQATRPNGAICECPYVTSDKELNIQIDVNSCDSQVGKTCEYLHNGNPDDFEIEGILLEMYNNITGQVRLLCAAAAKLRVTGLAHTPHTKGIHHDDASKGGRWEVGRGTAGGMEEEVAFWLCS